MKKILLLLLLATFSIQAQTLQNPTYGNVKLKNNTTDNSATKVNVQSTDGTINTISKADLVNVVEVNDVPTLPLVGEVGKIYVVKNLNKIYRWNGTFYQELAGSDISGLQAQIDLKANNSDVVKLTGDQTIAGTKTFSSFLKSGLLFINEAGGFGDVAGYTQLGGTADYFQVINGASTKSTKFIHNGVRILTMPATNGTLALTSNLSAYQPLLTNPITGTGTTNYIPKFTASGTVGNSSIFDNGTNVGIGTTTDNGNKLRVNGTGYFDSSVTATSFNGSATLTGTPTAPTATVGTNTTQIATTAFVAGGLATKENAFSKNTAFNKNFGITAGTVVEGGTLGSNAYSSTAYLPLTGGTVKGLVSFNATTGGLLSFQTNSLPSALMTSSQNIIGGAGSTTDFNTYVYGNNPYNIWTDGVKRVTVDGSGNVDFTGTMKMKEYTVATLPTPTGTAYATVTDALAPTYMATVVGGGAVVTPVFYNGTAWVSH